MKKIIFIFVGLLIANLAYAADVVQSAPETCDFIKPITLFAVFQPKEYECNSGYYLPANHDGCEACPQNYTCAGGTFSFNENLSQGLEYAGTPIQSNINNICAVNFPVSISAVFTPNEHSCTAGQYLPANVDACTQCPSGSYCVGGTYTFNETTNQGIEHCATGYSSPAGSDAASDCTGNIITIIWAGASAEDVAANNAGTVTYGGDIRTPKHAPHINGKIFTGWTFNEPSQQ